MGAETIGGALGGPSSGGRHFGQSQGRYPGIPTGAADRTTTHGTEMAALRIAGGRTLASNTAIGQRWHPGTGAALRSRLAGRWQQLATSVAYIKGHSVVAGAVRQQAMMLTQTTTGAVESPSATAVISLVQIAIRLSACTFKGYTRTQVM